MQLHKTRLDLVIIFYGALNRAQYSGSRNLLQETDRLLNKALQAPSIVGGCVIPITVPYSEIHKYLSIHACREESGVKKLKMGSLLTG